MFQRAWNLSGLAVRSAQALGLHLKDVSGSAAADRKDFRSYNWFALMTLETMLTLMTGRPSMINPRDCSVTIPRALAEAVSPSTTTSPSGSSHRRSAVDGKRPASSMGMSESGQGTFSNRMSKYDTTHTAAIFFVHYAELCMLAKEVVGELYRPGIRKTKWSDIQSKIEGLDKKLFEWKDGVNPPFNVASPSLDPETESCRVALRILFHSTRTIINRPCLCKLGERIQTQSSSSKRTDRSSANKCVDSARATLSLILHKPDSTVLHEGTMWWMLLHHVKRALTVLLLELAQRAEHMPSDADDLVAEAKAAVAWLHDMGKSSPETRRSCSVMSQLLRVAAQRVGGDTSDMMTSSEEEEAALVHPGRQQPWMTDYGDADQSAFHPPRGLYYDGTTPREQRPLDHDDMMMTARHDLDQFGFLRAEGGRGSLFPTESEIERMGSADGEDYDMEGSFEF